MKYPHRSWVPAVLFVLVAVFASATIKAEEAQFDATVVSPPVSGEVVVNAHENSMFDFFGMVKHRVHIALHGSHCDPKPLKLKIKTLPPPPTYHEIQVQVKDPPAPPTYHLETRRVIDPPPPKIKDRPLAQQECATPNK